MGNLSRIHNHIYKYKKQTEKKNHPWADALGENTKNKFI
jgi:hypothetical protein